MGNMHGILSPEDVIAQMQENNISIFPFNNKQLTGCGYNLTATNFVLSTKKGILEQIRENNDCKYVIIDPYDTALICTGEYVILGSNITGSIHSRVAIVSEGFGHISTTVDPFWMGPLLIAINNPSKRSKQLILETSERATIATLTLSILSSPTSYKHDNPPFRLDILERYLQRSRRWKFALLFNNAVRSLDSIIEMAKNSVNINKLQKKDFCDLFILEDILSKMACEDTSQYNALLMQMGTDSCKYRTLSTPLQMTIARIQNLATQDKNTMAQLCKKAFALCETEFIGAYWIQQRDILSDRIKQNSISLNHINKIAKVQIKIREIICTLIAVLMLIWGFSVIQRNNANSEVIIMLITAVVAAIIAIWK